jgi:hypothetical protein
MQEDSLRTRVLVALFLYLLLLLAMFTPLGGRFKVRLPDVSWQETRLAVFETAEDAGAAGGGSPGAGFRAGR